MNVMIIIIIGYHPFLIFDNLSDIDECLANTDNCGQICRNTAGSFVCACGPGYELATDKHTCNGKMSVTTCNDKIYVSTCNGKMSNDFSVIIMFITHSWL